MLVISRQSVFAGASGSEAYAFDFLRHAAADGWKIRCVITNPHFAGGVPMYRVQPEVLRVMDVRIPGCIRLGHAFIRPRAWVKETLKALLRKVFYNRFPAGKFPTAWVWTPADADEQRLSARWIAKQRPTVVLANYCWMTPCFPSASAANSPLRAVLTHDAMHKASAAYTAAGLAAGDSHHDENAERTLLERADLVIAISEDDAAAFRSLLPGKVVMPMLKAAHLRRLEGAVVPGTCLFVGSDFLANVQGLTWFVEKVWPEVLAAVPDARLRVVGKVGKNLRVTAPGLEVLGVCEDLQAEYRDAAAVIIPLLVGSGVKIKLVEALAFGKACVTTSIGTQGLPFLGPETVAVADTAAAFAAQLAGVLTDQARRMLLEKNAYAAAQDHLAPEMVYGPVLRRFAARGIA